MSPDDLSRDQLELELELLTLEVESLRGRVDRGESDAEHGPSVDAGRLADLERAQRDLRWLLKRLGSGVPGLLFRRRKGYRRLAERHLPDET